MVSCISAMRFSCQKQLEEKDLGNSSCRS